MHMPTIPHHTTQPPLAMSNVLCLNYLSSYVDLDMETWTHGETDQGMWRGDQLTSDQARRGSSGHKWIGGWRQDFKPKCPVQPVFVRYAIRKLHGIILDEVKVYNI